MVDDKVKKAAIKEGKHAFTAVGSLSVAFMRHNALR
jgi:hypothetical protein